MTGGRIKRVREYVGDETFMMTYGDGVCDVDIGKLLEFHRSHGKLATLTAVKRGQDKGVLNIGGDNALTLCLDFANLEYISSAGLRVLLSAQKNMAKQGSMKLIHVSDVIMEIFEVTGFVDILTIE